LREVSRRVDQDSLRIGARRDGAPGEVGAVDREGFQRLVADVGLGRAGIVLGLEVSRLARNSTDWHRLLLGLKGTMSEAELHMLRARLERLRQLAIRLEPELSWRDDEQPRAWLALERIYSAALQLNPRDPSIHLSRAIIAREHAEGLQRSLPFPSPPLGASQTRLPPSGPLARDVWTESPLRRRMMEVAQSAVREALDLAPTDVGHGATRRDPWQQARLWWDRYKEIGHFFTGRIVAPVPQFFV